MGYGPCPLLIPPRNSSQVKLTNAWYLGPDYYYNHTRSIIAAHTLCYSESSMQVASFSRTMYVMYLRKPAATSKYAKASSTRQYMHTSNFSNWARIIMDTVRGTYYQQPPIKQDARLDSTRVFKNRPPKYN